MREKMRGKLHRTFLTAFAFVFAVVFAGFVGKVDVKADIPDYMEYTKVTVAVKDTSGNVIENATVHFATKKASAPGESGEVCAYETPKNEDGTYNVPYDTEYGTWYHIYATADGYKTPTSYTSLVIDTANPTLSDLTLEAYSFDQMVEDALAKAEEEIRNYVSADNYDSDGQTEVNTIIGVQVEKLYEIVAENETKESAEEKIALIDEIVQEAKDKLDKVVTAQTKMNEEYADSISFISVNGTTEKLTKDENSGKYGITLSLNDKGGMFRVSGVDANAVNWNATKNMYSLSAGSKSDPREIIDNKYDKGKFYSDKAIPVDVDHNEALGTITDASATFTIEGNSIKVTFDLTITNDQSVDDKAVAKVVAMIDAIDALGGEITLDNKADVEAAKAAYDALSDSAKENVSEDKVNALNAAVNKIDQLVKDAEKDELIATLQEQVKNLQSDLDSANKAKDDAEAEATAALTAKAAAETRATKAEEAQKAAEKKATDAAAAQKTAETKAANAEKAQKDAETKAANAVAAQKAAEQKATDAVTAQKAAEQKAADAEKKMNDAIKASLPKLNLKVTAGKKKATLSWNKSTKGTGYIIYRSTSKNGTYVKVKTITNLKTTKFTDKNLKSKQIYYYKICVYQGNVNGTLSTAKNVKVK